MQTNETILDCQSVTVKLTKGAEEEGGGGGSQNEVHYSYILIN